MYEKKKAQLRFYKTKTKNKQANSKNTTEFVFCWSSTGVHVGPVLTSGLYTR